MINNKEILRIIEEKKKAVSCENCKFCHKGAFHSGKWYCTNPDVSVFNVPIEIEKCFVRKGES